MAENNNAGGGIFGGEEVNRQVVRFEKGLNNTIILRSITYVIMSTEEDKPITKSVKNSTSKNYSKKRLLSTKSRLLT